VQIEGSVEVLVDRVVDIRDVVAAQEEVLV